MVRVRQVSVLAWNTCGVLLLVPGVMLPLITSVSPLASAVLVGYQRPAFIAAWLVKVLLAWS